MRVEANEDRVPKGRRSWRFENGKLYFSPRLERKIFFVLTLVMLLAGIGYRMLGG
jgi:hypothetical protein